MFAVQDRAALRIVLAAPLGVSSPAEPRSPDPQTLRAVGSRGSTLQAGGVSRPPTTIRPVTVNIAVTTGSTTAGNVQTPILPPRAANRLIR